MEYALEAHLELMQIAFVYVGDAIGVLRGPACQAHGHFKHEGDDPKESDLTRSCDEFLDQ